MLYLDLSHISFNLLYLFPIFLINTLIFRYMLILKLEVVFTSLVAQNRRSLSLFPQHEAIKSIASVDRSNVRVNLSKDTTQRPWLGLEPGPHDPESIALLKNCNNSYSEHNMSVVLVTEIKLSNALNVHHVFTRLCALLCCQLYVELCTLKH